MIYDVTRPLSAGMAVYPGHAEFHAETMNTVEADGFRLSRISMGAHCGTHMDAPAHFITGGVTMEAAPLDLLIGKALVLTVETGEELKTVPEGTQRLFLRAKFRGLTREDALDLRKKGVTLIGTTAMSISFPEHESGAHGVFLGDGCWIVENLELSGVADGWYHAMCLPLKLSGVEGAPARVVLSD